MSPSPNDGRALQRLLDELGRLPGIGPKSAQRIAYYLLEADAEEARRLAQAILEVKQQVHFCPVCFSYATRETCDVCSDSSRDRASICVVSEPRDVQAIERTGSYHGLYHVLGGVISPMDKVGPEQLHVRELLQRLADGEVKVTRRRPGDGGGQSRPASQDGSTDTSGGPQEKKRRRRRRSHKPRSGGEGGAAGASDAGSPSGQ